MATDTIKKAPVFAEDWQLRLLLKSHDIVPRPSEEQRLGLAVATGLDEFWIRKWFCRQNRKVKRNQQTDNNSSQPKKDRSIPPLHASLSNECTAITVQADARNGPSRQMVDHVPQAHTHNSEPPRSFTRSPSLSYIPITFPISPFRTPSDVCLVDSDTSLTAGIPTSQSYSRDPLYGRYPDFSNFFLPAIPQGSQDSTLCLDLSQAKLPPLQTPSAQVDCIPELSFCSVQSHSTAFYQSHLPDSRKSPLPLSYTARLSDIASLTQFVRDAYLASEKNEAVARDRNQHVQTSALKP